MTAERPRLDIDRLLATLDRHRVDFLIVGGVAAMLPNALDRNILGRMELSTWRTDAGDFDVLTNIPARDGRRLRYDELIGRAAVQEVHGITVHVAALEDVIASKEWADRPKDREALPELRELATRRET